VLNVFRMFCMMENRRLRVVSTGALTAADIVQNGVKAKPDVGAYATRGDRSTSVMLWHYHDDDLPGADANINASFANIPPGVTRVLVRHYRVDETHSNSYSAWKAMGSPRKPTRDQYAVLEGAGQLESMGSPVWTRVNKGEIKLDISLPRQGVSLVQLSW